MLQESKYLKPLLFICTAVSVICLWVVFERIRSQPQTIFEMRCVSPVGETVSGSFNRMEIEHGSITTEYGTYFPGPYEMCHIRKTHAKDN